MFNFFGLFGKKKKKETAVAHKPVVLINEKLPNRMDSTSKRIPSRHSAKVETGVCKHCSQRVDLAYSHYCPTTGSTYSLNNSDDFLLGMAVGYATGNPFIGGIAGGNMMGGIVGSELNHMMESNRHESAPTPVNENNDDDHRRNTTSHQFYDSSPPSYDSGPSDYGSSDSSSCGDSGGGGGCGD